MQDDGLANKNEMHYYIDTSVLLETITPLLKFQQNHAWISGTGVAYFSYPQ